MNAPATAARAIIAPLAIPLLLVSLVSSLPAQVSINEICAESSEWRLKWDANNQPSVGAGVAWWSPDFVPAKAWSSGAAPLGWDTGTVVTDLRSEMRNVTPSLYLRKEFQATAAQAASSSQLDLDVEFDDGIIVWINGVEVGRCNMGAKGTPVYREQIAFNEGSTVGSPEDFDPGAANALLNAGSNVIAIQVANHSINSDLYIDAVLSINSGGGTLVGAGETWDYHVGHIEPSGGLHEPAFVPGAATLSVDWAKLSFDDSAWPTSPGPIGYDNGNDYNLGINLIGQMRNLYTSVYMRQEFTVTAAEIAAAGGLQLTADFDDGFIAYLNGVEIARGNMGSSGDFYAHSATSDGSHNASMDGGGNNPSLIETIGVDKNLLVSGTNVLSAQLHNTGAGSSDLLLDFQLSTTGGGPGVVAPNNGNFSYFIGASEPAPPPPPGVEPPEAEFADWFELHNAGASAVDLSGWSVSDDPALPTKFVFPSGTSIDAGGYLVVIADDREELNGSTVYLHCSFGLAAGGETLTLYDAASSVVSSLNFPTQRVFQSYGRDPGGATFGYLDQPTPGRANAGSFYGDRVDAPDFSIPGGFHSGSVSLTLTSETPGVTIRYTTDGTEPTESNGTAGTALTLNTINNKTGHVIRARAFKAGLLPSKVKTHTYLLNQSSQLTGVPALVFSGDEGQTFYKPHGVLSIEGGTYVSSRWQSNGKSSYNIPINRGRPYERAGFVEYFEPDGDGFREDAGIRIAASSYSRPRMVLNQTASSPFPSQSVQKPSFNVWFRGDYGDPDVDFPWVGDDYSVKRFEQLRARAGKNDIRNPFIVDELVRRLYHDMGQESALGVINTLYINGEFKGYYNLCERLREPFMRDHHNSDGQWDIRQVNEFAEGDSAEWDVMFSRIGQNLDVQANWDAALEYIDPVAIADYYLVNAYAAMWDWPQNNWVAARERSPEGRFRFYVWDAEGGFHSQGYFNPITRNTIVTDLLSKNDTNSQVFQRLHASAEWRLIFADRVHKHMFNGGVIDDRDLVNSNIRQRKDELVSQFQPLLSFVHNQTVNQSWYNNWVNQSSGRRTYLFGPNDEHFRDSNLWPVTFPPVFNQHGGEVSAGFSLSMTKAHPGTIYYTLDGSDPRAFGGAVASGAIPYSSAVALNDLAITAKARVRNSNGEWSPLTEAEFKVGTIAADATNLAVVEIMYNPAGPSASEIAAGYLDGDEFEFVRLRNIAAVPIDLTDVRFSGGVTFQFALGAVPALSPGAEVLLVENIDAFRERYGTGYDAQIAGKFGGKLSNGGEAVLLDDSAGATIQSFTYSDSAPWPEFADGSGLSLQIIDPAGDHDDPTNWRASLQYGGTPGGSLTPQDFTTWRTQHFDAAALADPLVSGPDADPDGDGWSNFLEFALGTLPHWEVAHLPLPEAYPMTVGASDYLALEFASWTGAAGLTYTVQVTDDLEQWDDGAGFTTVVSGPTDNGDGTMSMVIRDTTPTSGSERRFIRLLVSDD